MRIETVKAQIDVDNPSNKISYVCSNAKQTYLYMGLINGLKITKMNYNAEEHASCSLQAF